MSRVSCLIIAFSRLEGVERLLNSINPSEIATLYIAIDGPTSDEVRSTQVQLVNFVDSYCTTNSIHLTVWQRNENLGVAAAIISAIDWFFAHEDFGIVLEDDLVVGEDFFRFVRENKYQLERDDVLLISGDQFDQHMQLAVSRNWTNYPLIWGWATSREKWRAIRHGIVDARPRLYRKPFNKVENFWRVGTLRVRSREIDTWDIPLVYFMLQNRKLCLTPVRNLISNFGNDQFASHTGDDTFPLNLPIQKLGSSEIIVAPANHDIRAYNSFLERNVFQVRLRHSLLYIHFILSSFGKKRNLNLLAQDLDKIDLP